MKRKIKMLKSAPGSLTGVDVYNYEAGKEYEIDDRLAHIFVDTMRVACYLQDSEEKAISSPENKMVTSAEIKTEVIEETKHRGRPKKND